MVLQNAAAAFFLKFGVGTLMALPLVREPELKRSFYFFCPVLSAACMALGMYLQGWLGVASICLAASLSLTLGFYALYAWGQLTWARIALLVAVILGITGLLGDPALVATSTWTRGQKILLELNLVAASFLCGIVLCTLILGHWYLISPRLSFKPLARGALIFFAAVWIRLTILLAILVVFGFANTDQGPAFLQRLFSWDGFGPFFLLRIFWGILGPLILAFMIYKTAVIQSNQSATGILYVALVFVLIGELIADTIWALAKIPI